MAQVCPYNGTVAVNIVIHAQFALGYRRIFTGIDRIFSSLNKLKFIRLPCLFLTGLRFRNRAAPEALTGFDDALHMLFDLFDIIRCERVLHAKIVIETILYNRADTELRIRVYLLYSLGHDMRSRMAHDRKAVFAVKRNGFKSIACMERGVKVTGLPVDAHCNNIFI